MRIPKAVLGGFLILVFVVAAVYVFVLDKKSAEPGSQDEAGSAEAAANGAAPAQKTEAAPVAVKVSKAEIGDLVMTLKSPGEAYSERRIVLKAEVGGVVKTLVAAEGRHVRQGDLLVELDDREYRLRLERLEAQRLRTLSELILEKQFAAAGQEAAPGALEKLARAQAAYDKTSEAFRKGLAAQAELERAQADYELALIESGRKKDEVLASAKGLTQAEVDVKIARLELEKTRIRAPFAGIVTDIKLSPQERVEAGRELFTLVDIRRIKVKAKVLESEVGKVVAGRDVDLCFNAFPGRTFKGRIEAVSPVIDAADKTCAVHIVLDNPSEELKPGMHAEVEIPTAIYVGRLLVPQQAVLVRGGRKLVFAVEGDIAKWRYVEVGLENEHFAEVLPGTEPGWGVAAGDTVIVEGHGTLAHDTKISIVE
ncbi:MAG: efflux RND transporter periplasmic adaptor subunit [Candidatus Aminicenantes bacterium]|nr:efflux RND transporter periplasmic adaptor subunit [Candidatus Aminicenantes bacterium]